jgi:glycyl-tRNA synthetase
MITIQQLILRLNQFWEKRGCIIHQGHDLEVGAGTFNPATFLRCLGPEPYHTAYVEPSRRPSDARYGENPNRVQLFHQYQVILKPSPADIQEVYLKSLEAIGLKLHEHDIRFVHDDWESPTLGAWGLGWEVWVDGMEASQFTYFQAIASIPLKPISGEITYGLERLAMFIQGVDNIFDLHWNETLTLRDISHRNEVEWSTYNFELSSAEMWKRHFDDFEREAKLLAARNLPIPAYDFVIKASHAFNMLDARGVISVTERTGYIARVRDLARLVAVEYLASREKQGYPLLKGAAEAPTASPKLVKIPKSFSASSTHDFLLEIGSEQLPATFVPIGCRNLEKGIRTLLETHELKFESLKVFGTPRRLSVLVSGLQEGSATKKIEKKGPPISASFRSDGAPTPQGEGFLKSVGLGPISLDAIRAGKATHLEIRTIKDNDYLFAQVEQKGQSTFALLAELLSGLILNLEFPKKMRWGSGEITYARPLHWIVALFGEKIIPIQVGEIASARHTYGHAQMSPKKFAIKSPSHYVEALRDHFVLVDSEERKQVILKQLDQFEGIVLEKERVLPQVLNLTEWPQLAEGSFKTDFLKIPQEVLISEMVEHQKYFPIAHHNGKLSNRFIITADNKPTPLIIKGNQKVLSARLTDGVFLYDQDLKQPLETFNEKLRVMTFQKELGSMLDKVERIIAETRVINTHLEIADSTKATRTALLCKADLASALVGEFPELQGTIGKYYALVQKESPEVAEAIEEHWLPKAEGGRLPATPSGTIVSLADKIDNLLGYYSVGLKPSSSSDPYALRRQTIGLIRILVDGKHSVNLSTLLQECSAFFPKLTQPGEIIEQILAFITSRALTVFEDYGFRKDEIDASLQGNCSNPYDQYCKVKALHEFRKSGKEFHQLFEVYKRAKGQLATHTSTPFNPALAQEPAEKALLQALHALEKELPQALSDRNYVRAFKALATLQQPLAHLFDSVKILADDPQIRDNRIALLQKVFSHFALLVDFSRIQETG